MDGELLLKHLEQKENKSQRKDRAVFDPQHFSDILSEPLCVTRLDDR
jgi:hypothetical protein